VSTSALGLETVLPLIGARIRVIHGDGDAREGGDLDCVVERLDPSWPVRLQKPWRLCQMLEYDLGSFYWVLDGPQGPIAVDTLEDLRGIGRYSFPTPMLFDGDEGPMDPIKAAYLTVKRIRKRVRDPEEWNRIAGLAAASPLRYREALGSALPRRSAREIARSVLERGVIDDELWPRARRAQRFRRFLTRGGFVTVPLMQMTRIMRRIAAPTGLEVAIVGPDGAGKSTLASELPAECEELFRRATLVHWRPGLLPRPGALLGRAEPENTRPHSKNPHGRLLSSALLAYYWLDFFIGTWVKFGFFRARTGLVVEERGWWDIEVDPRRYRLRVSPRLVRALGRLLPRPDLALVLSSDGVTLRERKPELPVIELDRQIQAWRSLAERDPRITLVDTAGGVDQVRARAREAIVDRLHRRVMARLDGGWSGLPSRKDPRWRMPRTPRGAARNALLLYQPVTVKAMVGWGLARAFAGLGGFRALPRGSPVPDDVLDILSPYLPPRSKLALGVANHPGRHLALVLSRNGQPLHVAKVATTPEGAASLETEARAIDDLGPCLPAPAEPPRLAASEAGLLLFEAVNWRPRITPWKLPVELARALGAFSAAGAGSGLLAHGDFAPWNVLWTGSRWVVGDWENARTDAPPFFDVLHWFVRSHSLLGKPRKSALVRGFRGAGWIGESLGAYAEGADLPDSQEALDEALDAYVAWERGQTVSPGSSERLRAVGRVALAYREMR
jgi:hypothetical protein